MKLTHHVKEPPQLPLSEWTTCGLPVNGFSHYTTVIDYSDCKACIDKIDSCIKERKRALRQANSIAAALASSVGY